MKQQRYLWNRSSVSTDSLRTLSRIVALSSLPEFGPHSANTSTLTSVSPLDTTHSRMVRYRDWTKSLHDFCVPIVIIIRRIGVASSCGQSTHRILSANHPPALSLFNVYSVSNHACFPGPENPQSSLPLTTGYKVVRKHGILFMCTSNAPSAGSGTSWPSQKVRSRLHSRTMGLALYKKP